MNDQLEDAYEAALALEKRGETDAAAAAWARVLALDPEDHGGAAIRLAALRRGESPSKAPAAYVATLFDQHAEVFDLTLVDQLGYAVPMTVRQMLQTDAPGPYQRLLDLGCGTGLAGESLEDMATHLTGVDISGNMIAIADEKEVYQDLYVGEITTFLETIDAPPWDIVVATDVAPYLGDLAPLFAGVARRSAVGAVFCFSTETAADLPARGWAVGPLQRYGHAEDYVRAALAESGFETARADPITVRSDLGQPVPGHLFLARRRPAP